jgi:hypothetical protein
MTRTRTVFGEKARIMTGTSFSNLPLSVSPLSMVYIRRRSVSNFERDR